MNFSETRVRIAWFIHRYHPVISGAENYGRAIVSRFVADGHHADVFTTDADDLGYFTDSRKSRVDAPRESLVDGARVTRFPVTHWRGQKYAGRLLSYLPHWPSQCKYESYMPIIPGIERVRGDYDAVFGVGFPYTLFSYAAWRTAKAARAPLILTPFLHLATPGDPVNRLYTRPHQGRLLREADIVVAATNRESLTLADRGVTQDRVLVMGMGVEHDLVTGGDRSVLRSRLQIPMHSQVVGHLATLHTNKGTTDLVRAVMVMNASRVDRPVHLILAGMSTPEFESFANALPSGTGRWLHQIGTLPDDGRPDFYSALDIFAMPSRTDSYGIVFLEAWANGLPVVGAAAGGVVDVIDDKRDGFLVAFGDVESLAGRLSTLVEDPSLADEMGRRGQQKIATGYSWDDRYRTLRDRVAALPVRRSP